MRSTAQVLGKRARRPSRKLCRSLWEALEKALRRRAEDGRRRGS